MKTIKLDAYGIVIELTEQELHALTPTRYNGGSIVSDLKEVCEHCQNPNCDFDCPDALEWASSRDAMSCVEKNQELREKSRFNDMMDALESIILAHACAGIDVTTSAYLEGIETACNGCAKATE